MLPPCGALWYRGSVSALRRPIHERKRIPGVGATLPPFPPCLNLCAWFVYTYELLFSFFYSLWLLYFAVFFAVLVFAVLSKFLFVNIHCFANLFNHGGDNMYSNCLGLFGCCHSCVFKFAKFCVWVWSVCFDYVCFVLMFAFTLTLCFLFPC